MTNYQKLDETIQASVRAEAHELDLLHGVLYARGKIRRQQADVLVEMHRRAKQPSPAFLRFFYQAIKDHVLANDRISAGKATWLRHVLVTDGTILSGGPALLLQLKGESKWASREFDALCEEFTT